jgi:hypothetical protein
MAMCYCNRAAQRKISLKGANKDRPYWSCARRSCRWFAWADQETTITDVGGIVLKPCARPQRGNGLCQCGTLAVVTSIGKRKALRCAWERCSYFQGLASKPIPPAPTESARQAETDARTLLSVSQLVNRPKRLTRHGDVQPSSPMERHDGMLPYVLIARDGAETELPDATNDTIECARALHSLITTVSERDCV